MSWISKHIVVYPYSGLQIPIIKEWSTDTCYSVDEIDRHETNKRIQLQKTKYWIIADIEKEILKMTSQDMLWIVMYILHILKILLSHFFKSS